ncbi:MAG: ParB/RepB/Spo0J family partition protein [Phycisphaerae bacterium]|nr:ParB/RepB/Spo0J family partition protein [Phycisphaerae bacterium]
MPDKSGPAAKHHKPRLGRGLSSLIADSAGAKAQDLPQQYVPAAVPAERATDKGEPVQIPIESIAPNPYQARRDFKESELAELANSIAQQGILQPIIIAPGQGDVGKPYAVIAGERRLRAATQLGLQKVPCIIRQASRQQMLEWALIENVQRTDLNPVERAHACRDYIDRFGLTQAQAAQRLGQPRATVTNYLRILDLPEVIHEMLIGGSLSFGHAKVLAGLAGDEERQIALAGVAGRKSLSVRQLEKLAASSQAAAPAGAAAPEPKCKPPYMVDIERQLTTAMGAPVVIKPGRARNTGKIIIEYHGIEEFDRIAQALGVEIEA